MSQEGYSQFVQRTAVEMTSAKDVEENQFDCADFCITLLAKYYKEKGVRFKHKIGNKVIDSNDPKYKGETAWPDFVEDLKLNASASNLRNSGVSTKVLKKDMRAGDMLNSGGHVAYYLGLDDGDVKVVQSSGQYFGKGNEKNDIQLPFIRWYGTQWATGYRWDFLSDLSRGLPMKLESKEVKSIEIKEEEKTLALPDKS